MAGLYKIKHLTRIMCKDQNTNWEVRYYIHVGGAKMQQQWAEWDERLPDDFSCLQGECRSFPNIKIVAEVYGALGEGFMDRITASSDLWPSWPEDVT
ncbi:hypothetical protein EJ02DRAFT_423532 [Clathrospora elynae]|uniref:Uncharacterized protein n=1 Tax=Clathrospora elynae TaxID=706981 RepID=A0A6A5SV30_9PLEO|nr:hypothetical protein EJ02DRAFT_423532 [Clathrospora elynae]